MRRGIAGWGFHSRPVGYRLKLVPVIPGGQGIQKAVSHSLLSSGERKEGSLMGLHRQDYFPRTEDELVQWAMNYAEVVEGSPAAVGLGADEAALLGKRARDFNEAYLVVNSPDRTPVAVARKNEIKQELVRDLRRISQQIKANPAVSVELKLSLRIHVPELAPRKAPLGPPDTRPWLTFIGAYPDGTHQFRYADETTPDSRAKPKGVQCMQLFALYFAWDKAQDAYVACQGDRPEDGKFLGSFSTAPFMLRFPMSETGKWVKLYGRWQRASGLVGPWSAPVEMVVNGSA